MEGGPIGHHAAMPAWIDTHCHLDAPEFSADADAVRERAAVAGVVHCVVPAVDSTQNPGTAEMRSAELAGAC